MGKPCKEFFPYCVCNECQRKVKNPKCCITNHKNCYQDQQYPERKYSCKNFVSVKR